MIGIGATTMKLKSIVLASVLAASATAVSAQSTVKIGVPSIQTGTMAQYGQNYIDGVKTAVEQVNAAGGVEVMGRKLKLEPVFCDTQADSAKAAACGRRLSSQHKVPAMIMATSIETFPIIGFNATSKPPFLVVSSSASNKLVESGNPLVVRYWYNTYSFMPGLTAKLVDVFRQDGRKSMKVAFMQSEDEFGKAWVDTFSAGWAKAGGEVGPVSTFVLGTTDFYPQLTSVLRENPEVIAVPQACPVLGPIVKQARELGFKGDFIFDLACDSGELAKFVDPDLYKNSYFLGSAWNLDSETVRAFREQYKKVSKADPTVISADGYGQMMWVVRAIERAGTTTDAMKIRQALGEVLGGDWNILGITDLRANGETVANVFPRRFLEPGKLVNYNQ